VIEPLCAALKSGDSFTRMQAARSLGYLGDKRAVEPLIAGLADPDEYSRNAMIEALGKLGDRRASNSLLPFLDDANENNRDTVLTALGGCGDANAVPRLLSFLQSGTPTEQFHVTETLGRIGDPCAVDAMIDALDGFAKAEESREGHHFLYDLPFHAMPNPANSHAMTMVIALAEIRDRRVVPMFIRLLDHPADYLRAIAAEALGRLGDPIAIPALFAASQRDDRMLADSASIGLGWLQHATALDRLIEMASGHMDGSYRVRAVEALGKLGGERAIECLWYVRDNDADVGVSAQAAEMLRQLSEQEME